MQVQLPVTYILIFQIYILIYILILYSKFSYKIKQPSLPPPVKAVELMKKKSDFQCFAPWFALLIFQPCCDNDLREISLVNLK